jgi:sphinganine-1-phosphate aldolase
MSLRELAQKQLERFGPKFLGPVFDVAKKVPFVRERIEREYEDMLRGMEDDLKPYRSELPVHTRLPETGLDRDAVLAEMTGLSVREESRWKDGFASGAVYHGDDEHIGFLNQIYALNSQSNPLHADLWPSTTKYEAEVVSMAATMLGADRAPDDICGTVTSGGSESILLAMKTYRDRAGKKHPEMVVPVTAHAAFDKAAQYFNIKLVRVPVDDSFRADVRAVKRAINRNTVVVVGSAPSFPHGTIDPIEEMSELARARGVGFHTDGCLGGFVLPWAERLGYDVPPFDFRLPGVTSMSADTHKYGYAAKGTSVVLYRGKELRRHQYFAVSDWPGGLYFSPTFAGSRPGALSATCWAALVSTGESGYLEATRAILETAKKIRAGIEEISGLRVLGDPLWVIAFTSEEFDIYRVLGNLAERGWSLNGLHKPASMHICVTLRHTQAGVAERFLDDLRAAVEHVRGSPPEKGGIAPVYGMAATIPFRGAVSDLLRRYCDLLYEP